jgi:hypothetical protein
MIAIQGKWTTKNSMIRIQRTVSLWNSEIRFALLEDGFICQEVDTDINTKWKQIKELYTDTAREVLGYKIKTKKIWMSQNSWELIEEHKR